MLESSRPTAYVARITSGPAGLGYDLVEFTAEAEFEPSVTVHVRHRDGLVTWADHWEIVPDLEACGQVATVNRGPNTFGHVDCYFV